MNVKGIFGATFMSCLAALIIYDLVVKGVVASFSSNKYDNTFDPSGESVKQLRKLADSRVKKFTA